MAARYGSSAVAKALLDAGAWQEMMPNLVRNQMPRLSALQLLLARRTTATLMPHAL